MIQFDIKACIINNAIDMDVLRTLLVKALEMYAEFAEDWLTDVGAPKGKAYLYYEAMSSY